MREFWLERYNKTEHENAPRIYISYHPDDFKYVEEVCEIISNEMQVNIYYLKYTYSNHIDEKELALSLESMNLFIAIVSPSYLRKRNNAYNFEFKFIQENQYPFLPILVELSELETINRKFKNLQYLYLYENDKLVDSIPTKIKSFIISTTLEKKIHENIQKEFKNYIFFSYRKKDRKHAKEVMEELHKSEDLIDVGLWYDEFLTPGRNFKNQIETKLEKSNLISFCVTPRILEPNNFVITEEYKYADTNKLKMVSIIAEETNDDEYKKSFPNAPQPVAPSEAIKQIKEIIKTKKVTTLRHYCYLGLAYLYGINVVRDPIRGLKLLHKAADKEYAFALASLSNIYEHGIGTSVSFEKCLRYSVQTIYSYLKKNDVKNTLKYFENHLRIVKDHALTPIDIDKLVLTALTFLQENFKEDEKYISTFVRILIESLSYFGTTNQVAKYKDVIILCGEQLAKLKPYYKSDKSYNLAMSLIYSYTVTLDAYGIEKNYRKMTKFANLMMSINFEKLDYPYHSFTNSWRRKYTINHIFKEANHPDLAKYDITEIEGENMYDYLFDSDVPYFTRRGNKMSDLVGENKFKEASDIAKEVYKTCIKILEDDKGINNSIVFYLKRAEEALLTMLLNYEYEEIVSRYIQIKKYFEKYLPIDGSLAYAYSFVCYFAHSSYFELKKYKEAKEALLCGLNIFLSYDSAFNDKDLQNVHYSGKALYYFFEDLKAVDELEELLNKKIADFYELDNVSQRFGFERFLATFQLREICAYMLREEDAVIPLLQKIEKTVDKLFKDVNENLLEIVKVYLRMSDAALLGYSEDAADCIVIAKDKVTEAKDKIKPETVKEALSLISKKGTRLLYIYTDISELREFPKMFVDINEDKIKEAKLDDIDTIMKALAFVPNEKRLSVDEADKYFNLYIETLFKYLNENYTWFKRSGINFVLDVLTYVELEKKKQLSLFLFKHHSFEEIKEAVLNFENPFLSEEEKAQKILYCFESIISSYPLSKTQVQSILFELIKYEKYFPNNPSMVEAFLAITEMYHAK